MAMELEQPTLAEQFETVIQTEDKLLTRDFLDDQNISDVAELIYGFPEYESQIIANMSVHRAASVFKILDFSSQKTIIRELPANTRLPCSMNCRRMTVPTFWPNCPAMW
jgi:magnesium transporter